MDTKQGLGVGESAVADVEADLAGRLAKLTRMMASGVTADEVVDFLYWPEIVVAGEGLGKAYRGFAELRPLLRDYLGQLGKDCSWTITDPVVTSGDVASTLIQVTCRYGGEQPDANYSVIYVWQRRAKEWKVVHELVCVGVLKDVAK
jgi:hypothetical protein